MSIFLNVPGVSGGATEQAHVGWIPVQSSTFNVSRSVSMNTGHTQGREAALPSVSEVHISKEMDSSSIELFGWAVSKYNAKQIKIDIVTTGREDPFVQYILDDAVISGYSPAASSGMPMESITFSYTKITVRFTPVDESMNPGSPITKGFNISTAQAM